MDDLDLRESIRKLRMMVITLLVVVVVSTTLTITLAISTYLPRSSTIDAFAQDAIAGKKGVVMAQGFVVIDADGKPRADLGLTGTDADTARLRLFDEHGNVRFSVGANAAGTHLGLMNEMRRPMFALTEETFAFTQPDNGARAVFGIPSGNNTPTMIMNSANGKNSVIVGCADRGTTFGITRVFPTRTTGVILSVDAAGESALKLESARPTGNAISIGTSAEGKPFLTTVDSSGERKQYLIDKINP